MELQVAREMKKPVEDLCLKDTKVRMPLKENTPCKKYLI